MARTLLFALLASCALAQTPDFSVLDPTATQELLKLHIPGASVAIVKGDRVIYSKGFGAADIETREAIKPEMLFRLGSTTKMFTAAALVGLSIEGKIDLNAPLGKYLNFLPPALAKITADQLLSHTSGLRDEAPMYGSHDDSGLGNGIHAWTDAWLFTQPGKIISYSNPGYWMAGYLTETITRLPYADAMESRLFKPLGMTRTTLRPTMAMTWPLAQGHEYADAKFKIARPAADNTATWPAGSIFSNTHDLAQFVIAFMNEGRLDGKAVLDPKTIKLMSTPHAPIPGSRESYCYGLVSSDERGVHILAHSGSRMGYGSEIRMIPSERVAVIVQTNRSGATLPETADQALGLLVHLDPKPAANPKSALTLTAADLANLPGVYKNGDQQIEITARENKLFVKRGRAAETPLAKHSETAYAAATGGELIAIPRKDGKAEYLHSGLRSFARVN